MANGDTKTEAMLNVLGNGGTGDEFRGCCNTKTQSYILDAIDRINAIQPGGSSDFNDLENRPQLNGVAMTGNTNITNFTGTDGTNAGTQGLVPAPAAADADKFLKSDGTWDTAGGGAIELTTADYNYPESNPERLNLETLKPGVYYMTGYQGLNFYYQGMGSTFSTPVTLIVMDGGIIHKSNSDGRILYLSNYSDLTVLTTNNIANNLTTNSSQSALSARQGIVLKQMINYDLGNNGDDYPAASPDGLKLWDLNDGNYYLNTPRKIYLDGDINNGIDGFQGWIKVMQMSDGSSVDPEFTYIKIYGVMGDTTPFEVHQTTRRSNGSKISCQLVDTTDS